MRKSGPENLTGSWSGEFSYPRHAGPTTPFLAIIEDQNGRLSGTIIEPNIVAKGSTAEQVRMELRRDFPALGAENPIVVYRQDAPIAEDPAGLRALEAELAAGPRVSLAA